MTRKNLLELGFVEGTAEHAVAFLLQAGRGLHEDSYAAVADTLEALAHARDLTAALVEAPDGFVIRTREDLDRLALGMQHTANDAIAAEREHGHPMMIWEDEDGDLYGTDGQVDEDDPNFTVRPASAFLPFIAVGPQARVALAGGEAIDAGRAR